jgi:hypothetical protein
MCAAAGADVLRAECRFGSAASNVVGDVLSLEQQQIRDHVVPERRRRPGCPVRAHFSHEGSYEPTGKSVLTNKTVGTRMAACTMSP